MLHHLNHSYLRTFNVLELMYNKYQRAESANLTTYTQINEKKLNITYCAPLQPASGLNEM